MQVTSVFPPSRSAAAVGDPTTPTPVASKKILGQNDFLKLLAVQFQAQDPMKPMEDTAFIAQMAQFASLDQSSSLVQQMTQMRSNQDIATANSYIGRNVTLSGGTNNPNITGDVTGVNIIDGAPRLMVGDSTYPISAVLEVHPGVASSPTPPPATSPVPVI
jgi:flagellar basal-body rod modification protein FlgD